MYIKNMINDEQKLQNRIEYLKSRFSILTNLLKECTDDNEYQRLWDERANIVDERFELIKESSKKRYGNR